MQCQISAFRLRLRVRYGAFQSPDACCGDSKPVPTSCFAPIVFTTKPRHGQNPIWNPKDWICGVWIYLPDKRVLGATKPTPVTGRSRSSRVEGQTKTHLLARLRR